MGITQIAYFVYFVQDMARAKAFYTEVLGLEILYSAPAWVEFAIPGGKFALRLQSQDTLRRPAQEARSAIEFTVHHLDDFVAALEHFHVQFHGEIRNKPFGRLLDIYDPEGNLIHLLEPRSIIPPMPIA